MADESKPIRLLDLDEAEGPELELPGGRVVRVRLFDAVDYQLWQKIIRDVQAGGSESADALVLLQRAIPDLTAEERETLSPRMIWFIGQAAARKADMLMEVLRKNGNRPLGQNNAPRPAAAPSTPARSPRATKRKTQSSASGESRAATGGP